MMGVWAIMLMVELEAPGAFQGGVYWVRAFPILRLPVFLMEYCAARERLHAQRSGAPPPVRGPLHACCPAGSVDAHASVRSRAHRVAVLVDVVVTRAHHTIGVDPLHPPPRGRFAAGAFKAMPAGWVGQGRELLFNLGGEALMPIILCDLMLLLAMPPKVSASDSPRKCCPAGSSGDSYSYCDSSCEGGAFRNLLRSGPMQFLGEISMPFYLCPIDRSVHLLRSTGGHSRLGLYK